MPTGILIRPEAHTFSNTTPLISVSLSFCKKNDLDCTPGHCAVTLVILQISQQIFCSETSKKSCFKHGSNTAHQHVCNPRFGTYRILDIGRVSSLHTRIDIACQRQNRWFYYPCNSIPSKKPKPFDTQDQRLASFVCPAVGVFLDVEFCTC